MRTEREMFDLILGVAEADERIRAVYMNGSRANPNAPKDRYQDYDIVYVVTETASFLADKGWISVFGDLAIVQEPCLNDLAWGAQHDFNRYYGWMMLLKDGSRIDLYIETKEDTLDGYGTEGLTVPLLDKDKILPEIPPPDDRAYWIKPPTREQYDSCANNFWWCLNNVAKATARDQLSYAMRMYGEVVHSELDRMVSWYIGVLTEFSVSIGMWGKYFKKHLPAELYNSYARTYSGGSYAQLWAAVFTACDLFHTVALAVGSHFGFEYRQADEDGMRRYLDRVRSGAFDE